MPDYNETPGRKPRRKRTTRKSPNGKHEKKQDQRQAAAQEQSGEHQTPGSGRTLGRHSRINRRSGADEAETR